MRADIWIIGSGKQELDILNMIMRSRSEMNSGDEQRDRHFQWIVTCHDIWEVHMFADHFRDNLMRIVSIMPIEEVPPMNYWVVYNWDISEADDVISKLRIDIGKILWEENHKMLVELFAEEKFQKKLLVSGCCDWWISASDLLFALKSKQIDSVEAYIPEKYNDWEYYSHQSRKSQLKDTNSRFRMPKNIRK
ncbi:MAG: hypothetical protein ACD_3C00037G0026 [uncultured bacterium (gcode 4)]|uniref:Uncharacterized protein n=1 Tax=uncultured bacterium (gcode 4) TaxID=1234023 RepID=K2GYY5_9BACT|nr:MAG: hypothetical protein ACD_3C00037G0026 [uncultured bacterium (gcode 4)]